MWEDDRLVLSLRRELSLVEGSYNDRNDGFNRSAFSRSKNRRSRNAKASKVKREKPEHKKGE